MRQLIHLISRNVVDQETMLKHNKKSDTLRGILGIYALCVETHYI